jgi:hypothetical protein
MSFAEWETVFEREILPLRNDEDGDFREYGERYTEHLEWLRDLVRGRGYEIDKAIAKAKGE